MDILKTVSVAIAIFAAANACAQSYPAKPIRLVVPFPPGGPADGVARPLAQKLTEALGQPVVIDNRAGATGTIGAGLVAKSPPDGYTLLLGLANTSWKELAIKLLLALLFLQVGYVGAIVARIFLIRLEARSPGFARLHALLQVARASKTDHSTS